MPDQINRARRELAGVRYPDATWTSFDRYDRYGAIVDVLRSTSGAGALRVLDVGDAAGHLSLFDPTLVVVGLDIEPADQRLPAAVPIRADGTALPFADDTFDAVVSSDVLEHVPPESRPGFVAELKRVSRDLVVIAAPFDTPGVAGSEELVRRYAMLALGSPQPQLDEHRERGLPDLHSTMGELGSQGWTTAVAGNGNLWDWVLSMLLRFQVESRPALGPLSGGFDVFRNMSLAQRSSVGPWYRHLVVARRSGEIDLAGSYDPTDRSGGIGDQVSTAESLSLLAGLISADATEVARQDTVPRLDGLAIELADTRRELAQTRDMLVAVSDHLDHVVGQNADLRNRVEELFVVQMSVNTPLLGVLRRLRKLRGLLGRR